MGWGWLDEKILITGGGIRGGPLQSFCAGVGFYDKSLHPKLFSTGTRFIVGFKELSYCINVTCLLEFPRAART